MGRRVVRTSSQDLKKLLLCPTGGRFLRPPDAYDQVYPGILLGDASTALSTCLLKELKVTHVLNAAHGKNDQYYGGFVNTSFSNYDNAGIKFMGIAAVDTPSFYLRSYFRQAADFIEGALRSGGKVLIHCQCGISRSSTLVAAYLMLKKGMDVQEALSTIRSNRSIFPNQGFLSQLCDLEYELKRSGGITTNRSELNMEFDTPLKDPACSTAFHSDSRPMFSFRNYAPTSRPISRGGYPLSSPYYDVITNSSSRARSEDRAARSMHEYTRCRSASPPPSSFRTYRAISAIPDYYEDRHRALTVAPRTRYVEARTAPVLSSYVNSALPSGRSFYYTRTRPEPFVYSPRIESRPLTDAYMRSRHAAPEVVGSLSRTLTPRDSTYMSSSPYESYSYSSPYSNRTYSTYTPIDLPGNRNLSASRGISAAIRYPAMYPATFRHSYLTGLKAC